MSAHHNNLSIYQDHLSQNSANYTALSPIDFIKRAASVYPDKIATIHENRQFTWRETYERCKSLASALVAIDIKAEDTVSILAPNIPEHFEAHFAIPMTGAVLNSINTRLDADIIGFILNHSETKVLLVEREFTAVAKEALKKVTHSVVVVNIDCPDYTEGELLGEITYENFLKTGTTAFTPYPISDEWQAITLNYTSGTTGDPKGVVYHHRGAYLNAVSNALSWEMPMHPVYLWTLPMFHCNGWCFPWTIAAQAGINVCLRHVRADKIFSLIKEHNVGYFCGAPIVLNLLINAEKSIQEGIHHSIKAMTAGAAPPSSILAGMETLGIKVTHVYGLTETYGPSVVCARQEDWDSLSIPEQAELNARQGVRAPMLEGLMVADPETMEPVVKDGKTMGEIFMRGNLVMKGYLKNPQATDRAFQGGWFHSGDLAVWHPDGYVQIKDRSKDIIISGGENISSIELEGVLYQHPQVMEAAVVAKPDDKWGETPCAFITLKDDKAIISEQDIIDFCRQRIASFKIPKTVIFGPLPKTSTGKVQKYVLREQAVNYQLEKC